MKNERFPPIQPPVISTSLYHISKANLSQSPAGIGSSQPEDSGLILDTNSAVNFMDCDKGDVGFFFDVPCDGKC